MHVGLRLPSHSEDARNGLFNAAVVWVKSTSIIASISLWGDKGMMDFEYLPSPVKGDGKSSSIETYECHDAVEVRERLEHCLRVVLSFAS